MGKSRKGQAGKEDLTRWRSYPIYRGGLGLVGTSWERWYRGCRLTLDFYMAVPEVPVSSPLRDLWCGVYPEIVSWNAHVCAAPVIWLVNSRYSSIGGTCPHRTPRAAKAALQRYVDHMLLWGTMKGNPQ